MKTSLPFKCVPRIAVSSIINRIELLLRLLLLLGGLQELDGGVDMNPQGYSAGKEHGS